MARPFGDQRLGITKGGQLGRMLLQAAIDYELTTAVLDPDPQAPCRALCNEFVEGDPLDPAVLIEFGRKVDLLTLEVEHVSVEALEALAREGIKVRPRPKVLRIVQDKGAQKEFYRAHGIPTAEFLLVEGRLDIGRHLDFFPLVQKTRRHGYDGKGIRRLRDPADLPQALDEPSVIERWIDFEKEVAVLLARAESGEIAAYPLIEMDFHPERNLVEFLHAPAEVAEEVERRALDLAIRIAHALDLVGVLAVEMFVTAAGEVLVNEIAPRPHNSGHHTIEANLTSQYHQHLRAILGLPLGSTKPRSPAVMVNLLGEPGHHGPVRYQGIEEVLRMEDAHVHLYGKALTAPFRKMGHVTVLDPDLKRAKEKARRIQRLLKVMT